MSQRSGATGPTRPPVPRVAIVMRQLKKTTGAARNALEQVRLFRQLGFIVTVIGDQIDPAIVQPLGANPVNVWRWPISGYQRRKFFAWMADRLCRREKFDLVIGHGDHFHQDVLVLHNGVHLQSEYVEGRPLSPSDEVGRLHASIITSGQYKVLITSSQMMKKDLVSRFKIDPSRIEICFQSFSREQFNTKNRNLFRAKTRADLGVRDDEILLGLITSGEFKVRGVDYALQSLARLKDELPIRLLVVGKDKRVVVGKDKRVDEFKKLAEDLGVVDRVLFREPVKQVEELYHALDIFFLPARFETFARSALEAMACGLPVLVSNRTGLSEVLQAKQLIKAPEDIDGWVGGIRELAQNAHWRQAISRQNAERALLLDEAQYGRRFLQILRERGL